MKDKNKKRVFFTFQLYEVEAVKEFLEKMALEGWKLKDINNTFLFEKAEPQKLNYSVEIYEQASIFDTNPSPKTMEFIEKCKKLGWEYVCSRGKIIIFSSENQPEPIQTDETTKYKSIRKSTLRQSLLFWFVLPINLFNMFLSSYDSISFFTSNLEIFTIIINLLLLLIIIEQIISFIIWNIRCKIRLKKKEPVFQKPSKSFSIGRILRFIPFFMVIALTIWISVYGIINKDYFEASVFIIMILTVTIVLIISSIMKKFKKANALLMIISSFAAVILLFAFFAVLLFIKTPERKVILSAEDFGIQTTSIKDTDNRIHYSGSMIAQMEECTYLLKLYGEDSKLYINYSIFTSKSPFIMNKYLNNELNDKNLEYDYTKIKWPEWNAIKVYVKSGYTLVVYDDLIFKFISEAPLTDETIHNLVEKLSEVNS